MENAAVMAQASFAQGREGVGEQCSPLRRVAGMCSSTVSDTANMLRNIRKKKSSAVLLFGAVAGLRSAPDYEIKGNGS